MFYIRKRRRRKAFNNTYLNDKISISPSPPIEIQTRDEAAEEVTPTEPSIQTSEPYDFAPHIACYIGQTVTIFVKSGGVSGSGFSGILLDVEPDYIRLLTIPGPAPSCALRYPISCMNTLSPYCRNIHPMGLFFRTSKTPGAITYIPVDKIAAFVHNAL